MNDDKFKKPVGGSPKETGGKVDPLKKPMGEPSKPGPKSVGDDPKPGGKPAGDLSSLATSKPAEKPAGDSSTFVAGSSAQAPATPKAGPTVAGAVAAGAAAGLAGAASAELAQTISTLKSRFNSFLNRANLSSFERRIADITNQITALPNDIADIRRRGYAFRSFLENKAQVLAQQWRESQGRIQSTVQTEGQALRQELNRIEQVVRDLDAAASNPARQSQLVPMLQSALDSLEARINAVESLIQGMCESLEHELSQTKAQLSEINYCLDKKEAASFSFNPTESVFLVAEAEWTDDKDTPNGNLFLTDQRLVFEQDEKVGKKLGLFGGSQVHEKKWEIPLASIESVTAENKGLLGGKDMLNFTLGGGAPFGKLTVEVKGSADCKFWAQQIKRMTSGNVQDERAIEPDPELVKRLRNAPTACEICGGTLPQIVAGQDSVTCPYCGVVVRI